MGKDYSSPMFFGQAFGLAETNVIRKYLDEKKFKQYELDDGDLEWNDYDLCFPIADLYENTIAP